MSEPVEWLPFPPKRPRGSRPPGWGNEAEAIIEQLRDVAENASAASDESVASFLEDPASQTRAAIEAQVASYVTERATRNILDFGVERGTASSQTAAVKAALDAYPGEAFYFPPGSYRLDTTLLVSARNSLILDPDARIYAGAPMTKMIDYKVPGGAITDFAADKAIIGGTLDGALKADTILEVTKVLRMTMTQTTFVDGIKRGLVTAAPGAEVFGSDLRFHNTTASNWADNVALESGMGDCHYSDVVVRDWTVAFRDKSSTKFLRCHGWLGNGDHITNRYPTSVCFDIAGNTDAIGPYSDTYRTAFKVRRRASDNAPARARVSFGTIYWAGANLPEAVAVANQGYVLDMGEGCDMQFDHNWMLGHGHPTGAIQFTTGANLAKLSSRDNRSVFAISGVHEYRYGVREGRTTFQPTLAGSSVAGTHTYTVQSGEMIVRDDEVRWQFQVKATIGQDTSGNLRIGGLPFPVGAANTRTAMGTLVLSVGSTAATVIAGGTTTGPISLIVYATGGTEVGTGTLRGTVVEIWGTATATLITQPQD